MTCKNANTAFGEKLKALINLLFPYNNSNQQINDVKVTSNSKNKIFKILMNFKSILSTKSGNTFE